jgi:DNA replication ATP-dependent helicase Dna2
MTEPIAADVAVATSPTGRCFLCAHAAGPCSVPQVDGTLDWIEPRFRGGPQPALGLRGDDEDVIILLDPASRGFIAPLAHLSREQLTCLRVRVYHLRRVDSSVAAAILSERERASGDAPRNVAVLRGSASSGIVVEPDVLLNITDINHAEYCVRQYILRRIVPSPPNAATLRGTAVHAAFKELLKGRSDDVAVLLDQALRAQATDLALRQLDTDELAAQAEPHLMALQSWYRRAHNALWTRSPRIRVETFVLGPAVGLKGRLDALWEDEHTSQLLELKTSTVRGELPRREHRWQVLGYQALLAARGHGRVTAQPAATLLYSGTPGDAEGYTLPWGTRDLLRVLELRNQLAIAHVTGAVPPPPGANKCARCSIRGDCLRASPLLGWLPPPADDRPEPPDPRDAAWFGRFFDLLSIEGRAAEEPQRALWRQTPEQRVAAGQAILDLEPEGAARETERGEWEYVFRCQNTSELRENDAVLLSDGDPIGGEAVTGTILSVSDGQVVVWTPERIVMPRLLDRYDSDIVHDRTVRNLWRWLDVEPRLRELVRGERAPIFDAPPALDLPSMNAEQQMAIARALAARDFLLIHGPPGTGKTRVVAEIARRCAERGERVLLTAFTNQAVDNVLARLAASGYERIVRLGHELSVATELRRFRLSERAAALGGAGKPSLDGETRQLHQALREARVVATTTATWSAERYDDAGEAVDFDVAIVDEASQLTVPALLGALRFARRFILVGDERQLPPLVVSSQAAEAGLKRSLFEDLSARWGDMACVRLIRQYRMHPTICAFPSERFYAGRLATEGDALGTLLPIGPALDAGGEDVLAPERPVVFVDMAEPAAAPSPGSRASMAQARIVRSLVRDLVRRGLAVEDIGVIAPYRAQVAAVRQALAESGVPGLAEVMVDTVDRFQGGERTAIVLTLGTESGYRARPRSEPFVADPHRLNVALTRAQRKLIIVGHASQLRTQPLLRDLLAYCQCLYNGRGGIVRARVER